jgi:hypothetical protein
MVAGTDFFLHKSVEKLVNPLALLPERVPEFHDAQPRYTTFVLLTHVATLSCEGSIKLAIDWNGCYKIRATCEICTYPQRRTSEKSLNFSSFGGLYGSSEMARQGVFVGSLLAVLSNLQNRKKCLLRDIDPPDPLHPALAFLLLFKQLTFAGDVASVALGQDIFPDGRNGFAGNNLCSNGRLNGHLKHLAGNQLLHLGG